jgi:hypothetical protein
MFAPYASGSSRRKGARINGLLVGNSTVQFDKIDQRDTLDQSRIAQLFPCRENV